MGKAELSAFLGCELDILDRLSLCRRPDEGSQNFRKDVEIVSARFGIDPRSLAHVLREVSSIDAMQNLDSDQSDGFLMAARDRKAKGRRPKKQGGEISD
jgi:hypothetical protein